MCRLMFRSWWRTVILFADEPSKTCLFPREPYNRSRRSVFVSSPYVAPPNVASRFRLKDPIVSVYF